jgi:hypothetical protein
VLALEEKQVTAYETGYFICGNDTFSIPLPGTEKLIYMALLKYGGTRNKAWPSQERLGLDASCSRRRAAYAVETLIECGLVVKERRGNRSNLYMVMPPSAYNGKRIVYTEKLNSKKTESAISGVQELHTGTANPAHPYCNSCTPVLQELHTNITKNIKKNNPHQQGNREEEKPKATREKKSKDDEEEKTLTISEEDLEAVKKSFKAKKAAVKDAVIVSLLEQYQREDVQAAIRCCDFENAKNPLAVIKYMLREGNYVSEAQSAAFYLPEDEPPVDYELAKRNLKEFMAAISP